MKQSKAERKKRARIKIDSYKQEIYSACRHLVNKDDLVKMYDAMNGKANKLMKDIPQEKNLIEKAAFEIEDEIIQSIKTVKRRKQS